jgi:transcription initiation factor TFIIIB Brf1 subunit/transcription initiation factor TFIIB
MSLLNRIPMEEVFAAAHTVWINDSIADRVAMETIQIINQTYKRKFSFFDGKSSRSLVGGLFYLLGYRFDDIKKQNELADHLGTTDVTIRLSYRKWLETYPDLFGDVIEKFAANKDLRYYVLIELEKSLLKPKTVTVSSHA